jgi:hypothetical protein
LPDSLHMKIPMSVMMVCLVCVCCKTSFAAPRKRSSLSVSQVDGPTRLRSGEPAVLVSTGRSGRELRYLNVEVRNTGQYRAAGVQVFATCGAGLMVPLQGPKSLASGQRALYVSRARLPVVGSAAVSIDATCVNCRP